MRQDYKSGSGFFTYGNFVICKMYSIIVKLFMILQLKIKIYLERSSAMKKLIKKKLKKQIKKNGDKIGVFAILVVIFCALFVNKKTMKKD